MLKKIFSLSFLCFLAFSTQAVAMTVVCTNCSDKFTQSLERVTNVEQLNTLLNTYTESVEQTQQQIALVQNNIKQYENMLKNTKNLPNDLLGEMKGNFSSLAKLTDTLNVQKGDIFAMTEIFNEAYPDLEIIKNLVKNGKAEDFKALWESWTVESDRATEATFKLTGSQLEDIVNNSENLDKHINKLLSTPEGQMEAIQSGNALASVQIEELRQLRTLMATDIQANVQNAIKDNKEEQLANEQWDKFTDLSDLGKAQLKYEKDSF